MSAQRPEPVLSLGWAVALFVAALGLVVAGMIARSWWVINIGFVSLVVGGILLLEHLPGRR